jgi:2-polyprenyl-3-methyl-5-hydroxy-6-metoxy-1,4-benzoquinol methylase
MQEARVHNNATDLAKFDASDSAYYSEYVLDRKPAEFGNKMIKKWHGRLLKQFSRFTSKSELNILEVGAGHGQFAEAAVIQGHNYFFVDLSESVFNLMVAKGYKGELGELSALAKSSQKYDVIWISHVMEHNKNWVEARQMLADAKSLLSSGGKVVVVSPDVLSCKFEFWNSDFSHGFPTTLRNVTQLGSDVGMRIVASKYHRGGRFNRLARLLPLLLSKVPHSPFDYLMSPKRKELGQGFFYSWKTVFGWRQIMIVFENS